MAMIKDGFFEKFPVDEMYGLHNVPQYPAGTIAVRAGGILAGEDDFSIHIKGKGGHASAPDVVKNPLVTASEIVLALQTIVSRNVGCSVRHVGMDDIYEIYYMRANYEMMAVRLHNGPFPQENLEKMEHILSQMKMLHKDEYRKVFELDNEFHEAILDLASFKRLKKAWEDLSYGNIVTGYNMDVDREQVIKRQYIIHEKLLDACKNGSPAQVEQAIAEHYLGGVEKLIQKVQKKHEK